MGAASTAGGARRLTALLPAPGAGGSRGHRHLVAALTGASAMAATAVALFFEASAATVFAGAVVPLAMTVAVLALVRSHRLQREAGRLSGDLDAISQRLIRLEMRAEGSQPPARSTDADAIEEVTAEMGLLGEIVRDLAVAVAAHDGEVAALKRGLERALPLAGPAPDRLSVK